MKTYPHARTISRVAVRPLAALCLTMALASCANMARPPLFPGDPEAKVIAALGNPAAVFPVGNEHWLEYPTGPAGQQTYFAHINAEGKLSAYEQVLTVQKFATLKPGEATKQNVLRTIGHPAETSYLALPKLEVWSYRYKENDVWNSMMHVHFDKDGIVRKMLNAPDPAYEHEPGDRHHGFRR